MHVTVGVREGESADGRWDGWCVLGACRRTLSSSLSNEYVRASASSRGAEPGEAYLWGEDGRPSGVETRRETPLACRWLVEVEGGRVAATEGTHGGASASVTGA